MLKIYIPKPCHEDWNAMTPNEQGRHCNVCAKTVVDFTGMDDDAVQHYFLNRKEGGTCGRFKQSQLNRITVSMPAAILQMQLPRWKQFLAACLLAFSSILFSCDAVVTKGEVSAPTQPAVLTTADSMITNKSFMIDTLLPRPLPPICTTTTGITMFIPVLTTGDVDISIVEDTTYTIPTIKQPDTAVTTDSIVFHGGVSAGYPIPDTIKAKNPPAADSIKCDTNSTNYL